MSQVFQSGFAFCKIIFILILRSIALTLLFFWKGAVGMPLYNERRNSRIFPIIFQFPFIYSVFFPWLYTQTGITKLVFSECFENEKKLKKNMVLNRNFAFDCIEKKNFQTKNWKKKFCQIFFPPSAFFTSAWPKLTSFFFEQNAQVQIFRLYWLFQEAKKH